jgi:hypothetical protein
MDAAKPTAWRRFIRERRDKLAGGAELVWRFCGICPRRQSNTASRAVITIRYRRLRLIASGGSGDAMMPPPGGKTVAFVGEAPKRVGIQEWESLEKAQVFRNSDAFKKLTPQRDKAVKTIRSYAVEAN